MDDSQIELPSNRTFGLFFALVFALFGAYSFYHDRMIATIISAVAMVGFLGVTYLARDLLTPLNRLWMKFGLLLAMIFSPIVLGIMFFGLFTPIAVVTRLFGRDELRLKKKAVDTHWRTRDPAGPAPESFSNQF
jgi:hypothetical protein